jgi:uncharacterized protein (TIGR02231 family)
VNDSPSARLVEVSTRIVRVTAYEDRADVVREGDVSLPAGGAVVVVRGLSAVISDEHVVARLTSTDTGVVAHVNDVRVDRRVVGGDDDLAARRATQQRELEAIDDELRAASAEASRVDEAIDASEHALRRWAQSASLATGRGQGDAKAWREGLAAFERDLAALIEERAEARALLESVQRRRQRAAEARGPKATGQRTVSDVVLRISTSGAASFKLTLSTLLPCAAWRPTHEAWLLSSAASAADGATTTNARRVRFTTYAAVWNRTGEAWDDVDLVLSTARPSAGAELPPLRADRLTLRQKTAEERKTIVVEHREESVPKSATQGTAPGVDDGGQARTFKATKVHVPDDGRPHRVEIGVFEAPATVERVAYPELVPQVFLRASLKNPGPSPVLAGAVTLVVADGSSGLGGGSTWVGTGDVLYVGAGESFDLSFGSDDRFLVRTKKRRIEDKKLVGKDVVHFLREATLSQTGTTSERVVVHLRLPVSEVKQLRVLPSPQHSTVSPEEARPDEHGVVRIPVDLAPGVEKKLVLAFSFDASGDVRIPDPW